jgi:hypothetical protein
MPDVEYVLSSGEQENFQRERSPELSEFLSVKSRLARATLTLRAELLPLNSQSESWPTSLQPVK